MRRIKRGIEQIGLFLLRRNMRKRSSWSREKIKSFQENELKKLRVFAYKHSRFYQKLHEGLQDRPLSELPVVTKSDLMDNWDNFVTDITLRIDDLTKFLDGMDRIKLYSGTYHITQTSGSTPQQGILAFSPNEWLQIVASYTRALDLAGLRKDYRSLKLAVVGSRTPWHQSAQLARSLNRYISGKFIDATEPQEKINAELNAYQPRSLSAYPSSLTILAGEQLAGRLRISPRFIFSSAETLSDDMRALIFSAWGIRPINVYVASEASVMGTECEEGNTHLFDDLMIIEIVDNDNQPVQPGQLGTKILLTSLFNRTLPLIRYQIEDSLQLMPDPCPCGRPFTGVDRVQGRIEETFMMTDRKGNLVPVQPKVFINIVPRHPIRIWQVFQEPDNAVRICATGPEQNFDAARLADVTRIKLEEIGIDRPMVRVEILKTPYRNKAGKMPSVSTLRSGETNNSPL